MALHDHARDYRLRDDTPSVLAIVASLVVVGLVLVYLFAPRIDSSGFGPGATTTAPRVPTTPGMTPPAIPSTTPIDKMAPAPVPPSTNP